MFSRKKKMPGTVDKIHPMYFAIPAIVIYSIFFLLPIVINFGTAFTDWNTYQTGFTFTGLENFKKLIEYGDIFRVTRTTILFTITAVVIQNVVAFFLALALEKASRLNNFFRALFFAPAVIAIVVWGYLFQTILHPRGILNSFLSFLLPGEVTFAWLGSVDFTIFVVAGANAWMWTGFTMMIYIAAMNSIPDQIIEAARLDGLGYFGMIRRIIIPLIIPGLTVNIIISIIGSLKVFDMIMVMTKGGPGKATEVFNTWIYETYGQGLLGYASAMNIFMIIFISAIAFPIYLQMTKRVVEA